MTKDEFIKIAKTESLDAIDEKYYTLTSVWNKAGKTTVSISLYNANDGGLELFVNAAGGKMEICFPDKGFIVDTTCGLAYTSASTLVKVLWVYIDNEMNIKRDTKV